MSLLGGSGGGCLASTRTRGRRGHLAPLPRGLAELFPLLLALSFPPPFPQLSFFFVFLLSFSSPRPPPPLPVDPPHSFCRCLASASSSRTLSRAPGFLFCLSPVLPAGGLPAGTSRRPQDGAQRPVTRLEGCLEAVGCLEAANAPPPRGTAGGTKHQKVPGACGCRSHRRLLRAQLVGPPRGAPVLPPPP